MLILPAIDLIDGRTVRLTQGDYDRKTDYDLDPLEVAQRFEDEGADWLHVVDLDGAKAGRPVNLATLARIAAGSGLKIEFGGGLRDAESITRALDAGATRVVLGSRLARDLDFAAEVFARFGDKVVAGIDTRGGLVAIEGWQEGSRYSGIELAQILAKLGCRRIIWTDIARDGVLAGPNLEGLKEMIQAVDIPIIASGGVGVLDDIQALSALPKPGVEGVIIGKALYEGRFTVSEALSATHSVVS